MFPCVRREDTLSFLNVHLEKTIALGNEYKFSNHKKMGCFQRKAANPQTAKG